MESNWQEMMVLEMGKITVIIGIDIANFSRGTSLF